MSRITDKVPHARIQSSGVGNYKGNPDLGVSMKKFWVVTIAMLFILGFASVANADYTYTYKGNQLFFQSTGSTICYDPPFGQCGFLSGDFTLATPLPTNFTGQDRITLT